MHWKELPEKVVDWLLRPRSNAARLMAVGGVIIAAAVGSGLVVTVSHKGPGSEIGVVIDASAGSVALIQWIALGLGSAALLGGAVWAAILETRDSRKRVIVIEQRGLRDTSDTPLDAAVPWTIVGRRESVLIDLRERIRDGVVTEPDLALTRVRDLPRSVEPFLRGRDRADIQIVYGGMVPVPFAFLTGMILDDESRIVAFDWDRSAERWRLVSGPDDGDRFHVTGLDGVRAGEAVIAVSISYQADLSRIGAAFPNLPLVHLHLRNGSADCHWSVEKQAALAATFLETIKALSARSITNVHMVIAAQNSVAFRLGRAYDKRNLPPVIVYQYERSAVPAYPWGVRMPTHGVEAAVVRRPAPE